MDRNEDLDFLPRAGHREAQRRNSKDRGEAFSDSDPGLQAMRQAQTLEVRHSLDLDLRRLG